MTMWLQFITVLTALALAAGNPITRQIGLSSDVKFSVANNTENCEKDGVVYQNGESVLDPSNPCERCHCSGGKITCSVTDCYWRDDCVGKYEEGQCCPSYDHCPSIESAQVIEQQLVTEASEAHATEEAHTGSEIVLDEMDQSTIEPVEEENLTEAVEELIPETLEPNTEADQETELIQQEDEEISQIAVTEIAIKSAVEQELDQNLEQATVEVENMEIGAPTEEPSLAQEENEQVPIEIVQTISGPNEEDLPLISMTQIPDIISLDEQQTEIITEASIVENENPLNNEQDIQPVIAIEDNKIIEEKIIESQIADEHIEVGTETPELETQSTVQVEALEEILEHSDVEQQIKVNSQQNTITLPSENENINQENTSIKHNQEQDEQTELYPEASVAEETEHESQSLDDKEVSETIEEAGITDPEQTIIDVTESQTSSPDQGDIIEANEEQSEATTEIVPVQEAAVVEINSNAALESQLPGSYGLLGLNQIGNTYTSSDTTLVFDDDFLADENEELEASSATTELVEEHDFVTEASLELKEQTRQPEVDPEQLEGSESLSISTNSPADDILIVTDTIVSNLKVESQTEYPTEAVETLTETSTDEIEAEFQVIEAAEAQTENDLETQTSSDIELAITQTKNNGEAPETETDASIKAVNNEADATTVVSTDIFEANEDQAESINSSEDIAGETVTEREISQVENSPVTESIRNVDAHSITELSTEASEAQTDKISSDIETVEIDVVTEESKNSDPIGSVMVSVNGDDFVEITEQESEIVTEAAHAEDYWLKMAMANLNNNTDNTATTPEQEAVKEEEGGEKETVDEGEKPESVDEVKEQFQKVAQKYGLKTPTRVSSGLNQSGKKPSLITEDFISLKPRPVWNAQSSSTESERHEINGLRRKKSFIGTVAQYMSGLF